MHWCRFLFGNAAKCVQRKCRCTYVKFHRQTAPVGPGHNPRPAPGTNPIVASVPQQASAASRLQIYSQTNDDFLLAPPPTLVPSMAENLYSQSVAFSHMYPQPPDSSAGLSLVDNPELVAAKYRSQSDVFRRASTLPMNLAVSSAAPGAGLIPGLYTDPRQPATSTWMSWGQEAEPHFTSNNINHPEGIHDKNLQANLPQQFMGAQTMLIPSVGDAAYPNPSAFVAHRDRRGSLEHSSEGSSATSQSVPSSATSSSVHLPMEGISMLHQFPSDQQGAYPTIVPSTHGRVFPPRGQEGGFSSAFGLMSLDDPNVLAGVANDAAPFFSNNAMSTLGVDDPNQTPMPPKQPEQVHSQNQRNTTASTPSREAEIHTDKYGQHQCNPEKPVVEGDGTSSMRTTLHAQGEDLRSYEAAVLARKAPTQLSLGPRARRNNTTGSASQSQGNSPQVPSIQVDPNTFKFNYSPVSSRPGSATGGSASSSSLANWSGKLAPVHLAFTHDKLTSTSSPPSRESSVSVDESAGSGGSDREGLRPSFKRLPSQTLGPTNAKRTLLSFDGEGHGHGREDVNFRPGSSSSSSPSRQIVGSGISVYGSASVGVENERSSVGITLPDRPSMMVPSNVLPPLYDREVDSFRQPLGSMQHPHSYTHQHQHPYRHAHHAHHPERPVVNLSDRHRRMSAPTALVPSAPAFTFAPPGPGPGLEP
ncbi:hypothetical protein AX17_003118 [Amanita inopinata Kibby_2008]|nr:hypothetical protein AX17_003118 [Amanita inopinata Kibby_2008]